MNIMEQEADIILPASPRKLYDPIKNFDDALEEIFCEMSMELASIMPDEKGDVDYNSNISEFLQVTLSLSTISVTYPIDYRNVLPEVTIVYSQDEVKDVQGLLGIIGKFYDSRLTREQLILLREKDPYNEANYMDDEDNHIYNALIHPRGQRTTLIGIDGINGIYRVSLDCQ